MQPKTTPKSPSISTQSNQVLNYQSPSITIQVAPLKLPSVTTLYHHSDNTPSNKPQLPSWYDSHIYPFLPAKYLVNLSRFRSGLEIITRGFWFVCRRSSRTSSVNTTRVGWSSARDEHVTSTRCATTKCETCSSSASSAATGACRDTMKMYFFASNADKVAQCECSVNHEISHGVV